MAMTNHCIPLNFNINPVTIDHCELKKKYQTSINLTDLNPDLINLLKDRGINVSLSESFYSHPFKVQVIHTDYLGGDYVKINFIYGGHGSQMHWYKIKDPSRPMTIGTTSINTKYISWTRDMVDLVESNTLDCPSLVQTGCPHNVINKDEYRLCISLVLTDSVTSNRLTMSEAKFKLQEFLI